MKKKFFITTTVPTTLEFFKGNLRFLNEYYDVCAISSEQEKLEALGRKEGIRTKCIDMKRNISLITDFMCLLKFIWFFVKECPYFVHGNTPKASLLSMLAARITFRPVRIYMCHGLRYQGAKGNFRKLLMLMEKLSCSCSTRVYCVSQGVRDTLVADGLCKKAKAITIGYGSAAGLDLSQFNNINQQEVRSVRNFLNIATTDFVFIFVGRIVKDKGINELMSAFNRLSKEKKDCHLILVGKEEGQLNPISNESVSIMKENRRIHAVGRQTNVPIWLSASDAFVFPSYREGFGMVLIEAGAVGIPAISSNIIGCNEVIIDGENGSLIPSRNTDALFEKMKLWAENPEKVKSMSRTAKQMVRERYEQHFVWNAMLREYQRLEIE